MNLSLLHVSISAVTSSFQPDTPLQVNVRVQNNADHPVTILTWDSPLDPQAGLLGLFEMEDVATKQPVALATARFARQLPPSPDSFVEIKSHKDLNSSTTLPTIGLGLPPKSEYKVEARGSWRAVWDGTKDEISRLTLESMTGGSTGEFHSNELTVEIK
ncbi:uncharacterized protein KY384_000448 [Bacidia gigantensis]|uniref:uncharacterized protein n=1 Tax=Bacidia gigantensis TaxID=2732470 RepID=UPI001D03EE7C|nr:uncharacterized protein KY384_000448 [Bacidia gigantensis]KAG8525688.1 hypothetical protein KY384_000448 [Bacidia gigantensis]